MTEREAYKILGISPEAGQDEIKKSYRQLMLRVHPDMTPADSGKDSRYAGGVGRHRHKCRRSVISRRTPPAQTVYQKPRRKGAGIPLLS